MSLGDSFGILKIFLDFQVEEGDFELLEFKVDFLTSESILSCDSLINAQIDIESTRI